MDWNQALVLAGIFAANIVTVIMLYIHSDGKAESNRKETMAMLKAIQDEMKDFHGRLISLEERNRK